MNIKDIECFFPGVGAGAGSAASGGGDVPGDEAEELEGGSVVGEVAPVLGHLAELEVRRLDQIRIWYEIWERAEPAGAGWV